MRFPPALAAAFAVALTFGAMPAQACHGSVTTVAAPCGTLPCPVFYVVMSNAGPGMVFALYQESNGIAGVQRGGAPLLQGGYDDCFGGASRDLRVI